MFPATIDLNGARLRLHGTKLHKATTSVSWLVTTTMNQKGSQCFL